MKKNKLINILLVVLGVYAISCSVNFDTKLDAEAKILQQKCPILVDSLTRWDSVIALPNKTIRYSYTLLKVHKVDIDSAQFTKKMQELLTNQIITQEELKSYKDNGVTMSYYYEDALGQPITTINITPSMYSHK